jgi:hypothetical protein
MTYDVIRNQLNKNPTALGMQSTQRNVQILVYLICLAYCLITVLDVMLIHPKYQRINKSDVV